VGREAAPPVRFAAGSGEKRRVDLPDGSRMMLGGGSIAVTSFTPGERRIRLEKGEARFSVAHEARAFRVLAGDAEVVAHGTLFDVSLASGRTRISLIEGSVDVSYPSVSSGRSERRVARLAPGQQMVVGSARPSRVSSGAAPASRATATMLQFDDTPLASVVAQANRRSRTKILLAEPTTGLLRLTGAFRAGDAAALAESLEAAFRLHLQTLPDGTLVLHAFQSPGAPPK
jgi:transmembrane sensor